MLLNKSEFHIKKILVINICYSPTGRSVNWEKQCAEVLSSDHTKTGGTVFLNMDQLMPVNSIIFLWEKTRPIGLTTNHSTNLPGLAGKVKKFHPLPEPIRLHDLQNSAHSCTEKKINGGPKKWVHTV